MRRLRLVQLMDAKTEDGVPPEATEDESIGEPRALPLCRALAHLSGVAMLQDLDVHFGATWPVAERNRALAALYRLPAGMQRVKIGSMYSKDGSWVRSKALKLPLLCQWCFETHLMTVSNAV